MSDNFLSQIDFQFSISRLEQTNYFIQKANIPGFSMQGVVMPSYKGIKINITGDTIDHEDFSVTFKVDEDLENWFEIYNWMVECVTSENAHNTLYSDASLIIMNSRKNPRHQFTFRNLSPIGLTGINLDATSTVPISVTAEATFKFDYFDYKLLEKST